MASSATAGIGRVSARQRVRHRAPSARETARDNACGGAPRARSSRASAISARKRGRSSRGAWAATAASSAAGFGDQPVAPALERVLARALDARDPAPTRRARRADRLGIDVAHQPADVLHLPLAAAPARVIERACDRIDSRRQRAPAARARRAASDRARPAPRPCPAARASRPCAASSKAAGRRRIASAWPRCCVAGDASRSSGRGIVWRKGGSGCAAFGRHPLL